MVIRHNMSALNATRQFGINHNSLAKTVEKLSSGYRVNRAADDAAGLAISEKMRRQIRGLTQASANAQDGISMVQTAEGALNEVHDMLQRMNELSVKAANDTMTYDDRAYIQEEMYALIDELNRVGDTTTFNNIKLFDGLPQTKATAVAGDVTVNGAAANVTQATDKVDAFCKFAPLQIGDEVSLTNKKGERKYYKIATRDQMDEYRAKWNKYEADKRKYDVDKAKYDADMLTYDPSDPSQTAPTPPTPPTEPLKRDGTSAANSELMEMRDVCQLMAGSLARSNAGANVDLELDSTMVSYVGYGDSYDGKFNVHFYGPLPVNLQVGAEKDQYISFKIKAVNAASLGVHEVNVKGYDNTGAAEAIDAIKGAISRNSRERSKLGAVQNRLEHTIKNLDNVIENTTHAESMIRDTDMAKEMVSLATKNILEQAGYTFMAQSNQTNQGVLALVGKKLTSAG